MSLTKVLQGVIVQERSSRSLKLKGHKTLLFDSEPKHDSTISLILSAVEIICKSKFACHVVVSIVEHDPFHKTFSLLLTAGPCVVVQLATEASHGNW